MIASAAAPSQAFTGPACGMTWGWVGTRGEWDTPAAAESMQLMMETEVNWVALAYAAIQDTPTSTAIHYPDGATVTHDEIVRAVRRAHGLGLSVCLKPVVNCADGTWRAHIGFLWPDVPGEPTWGEWFASYTEFVLDAARIAAAEGCEMLSVGCEMVRADDRADHWRALIAAVREVYAGPITYNCDKYQEDRLEWWDAVDVISSSGYYPSGEWEVQLDRIEAVVARIDKPFLFLEAGCPSREGSPARPNDWALPGAPSGAAQAAYYEEMFAACRARPWVRGFMLWDWPAMLYPAHDAVNNDGYCVFAKPAAEVVARWYRAWCAEEGS